MAKTDNIRNSHAREQLRKLMKERQEPCHICGMPIDYSLPARHPLSFEMDEVIPVSRLPKEQRKAAACDPANVRPAHRICNEHRGNKLMNELHGNSAPIARSRAW